MNKETKYEIYKVSFVINSLQAILLYGGYSYIFTKYITLLETLEEPLLIFIGMLFFIYISLGRVLTGISNIFSENKYHIYSKTKKD